MEKEIEEIMTTEEDIDENNNKNKKYDESRVYYVYKHVRLDNNTCFYIGKGKNGRKDVPNRNPTHDSICKRHEYKVVIFKNKLNEEEAFKLEVDLIRCYVSKLGYGICIKGYMNNNNKFLTNRTWGGEGCAGLNPYANKTPEEIKEIGKKISEKISGENHYLYGKYHSEEYKKKMSELQKGEKNPMFGKNAFENKTKEEMEEISKKISEKVSGEKNPMFGKNPYANKTPEEMKIIGEKMSESRKGEKNGMWGKGKKVTCITTGEEFDSINQAATHYKVYKVSKSTIIRCCKGKQKSAGELNGVRLQWKYSEEDDDNESKAV